MKKTIFLSSSADNPSEQKKTSQGVRRNHSLSSKHRNNIGAVGGQESDKCGKAEASSVIVSFPSDSSLISDEGLHDLCLIICYFFCWCF